MRKLLLFFCVLAGLSAGAHGAPPATQPVNCSASLKAILDKHETVPGMAVALIEGDRVTTLGAAGVRKFGDAQPMTPDDLIHLGSCTKAMTATLIGQLIDAKQLAMTTTMAEAFPRLSATMNPDMAKVTVAQLLHHTAGLPANLDWGALDRTKKTLREQRSMAIEQALKAAPQQQPGAKYSYANTGYVLLGAILEEKTGKAWEDLIQEKLFGPLGMTTAGFGPPGKRGQIDQPWGHVIKEDRPSPLQSDNPPVLGPAGRVHCTISDWGKFISLYLQAEQGKPRLLTAETFRALTEPDPIGKYAGGWLVTRRAWGGDDPVLTHAGSNTMWFCVVWASPKRDFAVLAAANIAGDEAAKACDEAAWALIQLHDKKR